MDEFGGYLAIALERSCCSAGFLLRDLRTQLDIEDVGAA